MRAASAFLRLLKKDLLLELRGREGVSLIVSLALLLTVLIACAVQQSFLEDRQLQKLYPALLWCIMIVTATVTLGRSHEQELENSALEGLLLSSADPSLIYGSKTAVNLLVILIGHSCCMLLLSVLLNLPISPALAGAWLVSVPVLFAYSSAATLINAISGTSRLKGLLLPIILLPLLFPLMFCALELTASLLEGSFRFDSAWFSLLLALDIVYFTLGFNLYEYTLKE